MAVSCHHENWHQVKGCFIRIQVTLPKKIAGKFLDDFFIVSLCQKMCSQKPWHYQKQNNVFQNSWSSTLLWPVLPQEAAMHTSNSWCCSLFPKAPGPSITNMIFPSGKKPESTHIQTPQPVCVCVWLSSAHLHQVPSPNISASWHSCDAIEPWHLGSCGCCWCWAPPRPNRFLRFMPTKQVEQAATVHNPRSCLGSSGCVFLPSWVTNIWWCSFLFQWWDMDLFPALEGIHDISWLLTVACTLIIIPIYSAWSVNVNHMAYGNFSGSSQS